MEDIIVRNMITILKILRDESLKIKLDDVILPYNGNTLIKKLKNSRNIDEAINVIKKSSYAKSLSNSIDDFKKTNSLINFEKDSRKYLLRKLKHYALHNILSIDVMLNFMFEQDIEVKNILLIFKAKEFGMGNEFIEQNLII